MYIYIQFIALYQIDEKRDSLGVSHISNGALKYWVGVGTL